MLLLAALSLFAAEPSEGPIWPADALLHYHSRRENDGHVCRLEVIAHAPQGSSNAKLLPRRKGAPEEGFLDFDIVALIMPALEGIEPPPPPAILLASYARELIGEGQIRGVRIFGCPDRLGRENPLVVELTRSKDHRPQPKPSGVVTPRHD